jgi:hypothetical protein
MTETENEGAGGASASNSGLGAGVLVDGVMVAWFADFTEEAREWCTENHFGRWLVWRATRPEIVPITPEELARVEAEAQRLADLFKEAPNAKVRGASDD